MVGPAVHAEAEAGTAATAGMPVGVAGSADDVGTCSLLLVPRSFLAVSARAPTLTAPTMHAVMILRFFKIGPWLTAMIIKALIVTPTETHAAREKHDVCKRHNREKHGVRSSMCRCHATRREGCAHTVVSHPLWRVRCGA